MATTAKKSKHNIRKTLSGGHSVHNGLKGESFSFVSPRDLFVFR